MINGRAALVTGSAGFIGFHLCQRLLADGYTVTGLDGMTDYYDVALKQSRLDILSRNPSYTTVTALIEDDGVLMDLVSTLKPDVIIHLAAQAGVRHSIDSPRSYLEANLIGTFNLLEAVRAQAAAGKPCAHLLMASTSSIYGANSKMPYAETDKTDLQMSFYAATKKSNEAMAHSYAHLYDIPTTMFRFFTVYGPWGRPDMALFKFTNAILAGTPIDVYNKGEMLRDFTYVTDLIEGVSLLINEPPTQSDEPVDPIDSLSPIAPFRIINIGNGSPTRLVDYIAAIEGALGITAEKNMMEMQPGDMYETWADTALLRKLTGFEPKTTLNDGVVKFVAWYRDYYRQ